MKIFKNKYFNYVRYANKLTLMSDEELQAEMEFRKAALRMCEQMVQLRRKDARSSTKPRAANDNSVASK